MKSRNCKSSSLRILNVGIDNQLFFINFNKFSIQNWNKSNFLVILIELQVYTYIIKTILKWKIQIYLF